MSESSQNHLSKQQYRITPKGLWHQLKFIMSFHSTDTDIIACPRHDSPITTHAEITATPTYSTVESPTGTTKHDGRTPRSMSRYRRTSKVGQTQERKRTPLLKHCQKSKEPQQGRRIKGDTQVAVHKTGSEARMSLEEKETTSTILSEHKETPLDSPREPRKPSVETLSVELSSKSLKKFSLFRGKTTNPPPIQMPQKSNESKPRILRSKAERATTNIFEPSETSNYVKSIATTQESPFKHEASSDKPLQINLSQGRKASSQSVKGYSEVTSDSDSCAEVSNQP